MSAPLIIGFDPGTSTSSMVLHDATGEKLQRTIPSFIARGNPSALEKFRPEATSEQLFEDKDYIIQHKSTSHYVGKLAYIEKSATCQFGDPGRYSSDFALRIFLTLVGSLVQKESITCKIVTGLPITLHNESNIQKIRERFVKVHKFILNGMEREVRVLDVAVQFEGGGALLNYPPEEEGEYAVIDIGGRTTDLFFVEKEGNKIIPSPSMCGGEVIGVKNVVDAIDQFFYTNYNRKLNENERRKILEYYLGRIDKPTIKSMKVEHPYELEDIEQIMADIADEILSFVGGRWSDDEEEYIAQRCDEVLLLGGGAYYFEKFMLERIPHLRVPEDPEMANVNGYLAYGEMLTEEQWRQFHV